MQAVLRSIIFPNTFVAPALVAGLRDRERRSRTFSQPDAAASSRHFPNVVFTKEFFL
jgi:hypothetical protein